MQSRSTSERDGQCDALVISNEFARVEISRDDSANGTRLRIHNSRTGREVFLDPLQLESLTWQDDALFARLLHDPFGPADDGGARQ
ncbi:hypothetical protein GCM10023403_61410 [Pseudonocardia benzenivorans]